MNAFDILGATPEDTNEQLRELLDEKLLLTDDEDKLQNAYFELSNPKKRIKQEVLYFSDKALDSFNKTTSGQLDQELTISEVADTFAETGLWFENCHNTIVDRINEARKISGFTHIEETTIIFSEVEALKKVCISSATSYFDKLTQNRVVRIFNAIVKINNYESYFIDELLAYYELYIGDTLKEKEQNCLNIINEINDYCNKSIETNNNSMLERANDRVRAFKDALEDWDKYAQPLQVNMQHRGGEHETSSDLVYTLRDIIINAGNKMQSWICQDIDKLNRLNNTNDGTVNFYSLYFEIRTTRQNLGSKAPTGIFMINILVKLIDILSSVFAELEIVAEKLKKDKEDLLGLKDTLNQIKNDIKDVENKESQAKARQELQNRNKSMKSAIGGLAVFLGIVMIIGLIMSC